MPAVNAVASSSQRILVADPSQVGEARRISQGTCRAASLDDSTSGRVAIIATEAAANVVRHGNGGEVVLRALASGTARGVEVLALDRGRGIADVARALQDGHSTGGTPGTGLGAIKRLSTVFDLFTVAGQGTAVLSQVWTGDPGPPVHGAVCLAKKGEPEPGDVWAIQPLREGWRMVVADGLGHGPQAREAALAVVAAIMSAPDGIVHALTTAHLVARATRGGAASVAEVNAAASEVRYAGIGNVSGIVVSGATARSMVSVNGTLGQGVTRPREFTYGTTAGAVLVLHSDGLTSRWTLEMYPGLQVRHPALIAGVLYRDHSRGTDDVTVVAARLEARP